MEPKRNVFTPKLRAKRCSTLPRELCCSREVSLSLAVMKEIIPDARPCATSSAKGMPKQLKRQSLAAHFSTCNARKETSYANREFNHRQGKWGQFEPRPPYSNPLPIGCGEGEKSPHRKDLSFRGRADKHALRPST